MRLWSLHPKHLDAKGLVALWREALLAQAVLAGKTRGYKKHPQLERFKSAREPLRAIGAYLSEVEREAHARGYEFDKGKIIFPGKCARVIHVTEGQLKYEWLHLQKKLFARDRRKHGENLKVKRSAHPSFRVKKGKIESWERK